ncbi:hypothetical protein [Streptomyces fractus]|uniref:hypothetical protein n=1 Tax=Streptomyces fractus TaxID=641806 RepID=UPI003CF83120
MTDIERAEADGVDKGVAMDPAVPTTRREPDHAPGSMAGREADGKVAPEPGTRAGRRSDLVPAGEREALEGRLRHALTGFVDEPRAAVEEADHVLEDLTARLTETLAGHRRTLRTTWQGSTEDTERLRLALRDYRETAERLLSL